MTKSWFDRRNQKIFRRHYSRKRRLTQRFDFLNIGLALIIIFSVLLAWGESYDLSQANSSGFVLWFLMFLAYLPLELLCLIDWCTAGDFSWLTDFLFARNPAMGLGIVNLLLLLIFWGGIRVLAARKFGENLLRITGHVVLIFLIWGCFQLGCSLVMRMWEQGGISAYHTHLQIKK